MDKELLITLKMTRVEARRLADMCDHIGEEAHDDPGGEDDWFEDKWWYDLADHIRDQMREQDVKEGFIMGFEENRY